MKIYVTVNVTLTERISSVSEERTFFHRAAFK